MSGKHLVVFSVKVYLNGARRQGTWDGRKEQGLSSGNIFDAPCYLSSKVMQLYRRKEIRLAQLLGKVLQVIRRDQRFCHHFFYSAHQAIDYKI